MLLKNASVSTSTPVVFVQLLPQCLEIEGRIARRRTWLRRRHDFSGVAIKLVGCGCFKEEEEAVDCGHAFGTSCREPKGRNDDHSKLLSTMRPYISSLGYPNTCDDASIMVE